MYVHVFSFLYFYSRSIKHVCGCVFILYFYSCSVKPGKKIHSLIII